MPALERLVPRDRSTSVISLITLAVLIVLALVFGQRFFSPANGQSMATQVAEFGLLALAMALAILTGGIDLSIVATAVLAGIVGAKIMSGDVVAVTPANSTTLVATAVIAMVLTGMACGLLNGLLIAKLSIPPILATLGTMILFSGIGMVLTDGQSVGVAVSQYSTLGILTVAYVPVVFLITVVAFVAVGALLRGTVTGRRVVLFGENNVALRFSGARNERVVLLTYVLIGAIVGLAAIIMVSRVNSARVGFGGSYLLQAILVVVLAGFDPYGGRGRVLNLAISLVLLQSLSSAFTIARFSPYVTTFIWGAMLLLVMVVNHLIDTGRLGRGRRRTASAPPGAGGHPASAPVGAGSGV